ncbi:hypothetical protein PMAYCL1PPCAC_30080, partial [Pristionchus mayeri]
LQMRSLLFTSCILAAVSAFIIDPILKTRWKRDCPMSPYALFLTNDQQQTLHELITEARQSGASEDDVKQHMERYIGEVLPPSRFSEFKRENEKFEKNRAIFVRGKRSVESGEKASKQLPQRVFDLVDYYSTAIGDESPFTRFYEESSAKVMRKPLA